MRAIAILLVLFSHTSLLMYPETESTILTIIRFFGAIGVDIFFVLSGFLIGGILLKQIQKGETKGKHMGYFLVRRWLRTLPNYYLILIVNVCLIYFLHRSSLEGIPPFFLFLQNFGSGQMDFFTESWSLSIEEFAYIIGPALLMLFFFMFGKASKKRLFLWVVLVIILFVSLLRLYFHLNETIPDYTYWSQNLRKVVIFRIDSIYYGFIAAYLANTWQKTWRKNRFPMALLGAILFFGMHMIIFLFDVLPENASFFYNLLYLPLVSISIAFFLPVLATWKDTNVLRNPITWISVISYSLYLVNYSIVLLTMENFIDVTTMTLLYRILIALLFWVISICLSYALYRWFERPMMNLRDKPFILDKFK